MVTQINRLGSVTRQGVKHHRREAGKENLGESGTIIVDVKAQRQKDGHPGQTGGKRQTRSAFLGLLMASLLMLCFGTAPSRAEVIQLTQSLAFMKWSFATTHESRGAVSVQ